MTPWLTKNACLTIVLAACLSGCFFRDLGQGLGEALADGIAGAFVCAFDGAFERGENSVVEAGTGNATYIIRDDDAPHVLMLGTFGAVQMVGISQAAAATVKNPAVVSISGLASGESEENCWAHGTISANQVGRTSVDVAGGDEKLSANLEVAKAERFEVYDGQQGFADGQVLNIRVGERSELRFRALDGKMRELAYLESVEWTVSGSSAHLATLQTDADGLEGLVHGPSATNASVTLFADAEGFGRLFLTMGDTRLALTLVVSADASDGGMFDASAGGDADSGIQDENLSSK